MTDSQTPTYRSQTTTDEVAHRAYYEAAGEDITVREDVEDADGVFEIRMPIATTGEVRNEGDDPLTRDELEGMATQIGDGVVSVFPDHGRTSIGGPQRYSIGEKGGEWTDAEVMGAQDADSGEAELVATARLMDPDTLPDIPVREMLGTIKELVNRDMSVPSSIGWREDDSAPGGNDLMEASIVGIPADPRTKSDASAAVVARAAVDAGADADALVDAVRAAIDGERPLGPPEDPDRFDTFEECKQALMEDGDLSEAEAERICGSWEQAKDQSMTEQDAGENAGTTDDEQDAADEADEQTERDETPEWVSELRDLLESIHDAVREDDDMDEDDEDEEEQENDDEDDDEDEEDDEQSTTEQDVDDEVAERIATLEDELEKVRSGEIDVESPGGEDEQNGEREADADGEDGDPLAKYNLTPN